MRKLSILASWITAPHVKRPMKPTDFYMPESEKRKTTPEESRKIISKLEEQMGVK